MWNDATVAQARRRMQSLSKELSEELGFEVNIKCPPGKFSSREVTFHLTLTAESKLLDGMEEFAWNQHCEKFGLTPNDRLRTISCNEQSITMLTLEPKNKKYPIIAVKGDGKRIKLPVDAVKRCLDLKVLTASGQAGPEGLTAAAALAAAAQSPTDDSEDAEQQQQQLGKPAAAAAAAGKKKAKGSPAKAGAAAGSSRAAAAAGGAARCTRRLTGQQLEQLRSALQDVVDTLGLDFYKEMLEGFDEQDDDTLEAQYKQLVGEIPGEAADAHLDEEAEAAAWDEHCEAYGFSPEHRLSTVTIDNKTYTLRSIKPTNKKYPVIASKDGSKPGTKRAKLPADQVKAALGLTSPSGPQPDQAEQLACPSGPASPLNPAAAAVATGPTAAAAAAADHSPSAAAAAATASPDRLGPSSSNNSDGAALQPLPSSSLMLLPVKGKSKQPIAPAAAAATAAKRAAPAAAAAAAKRAAPAAPTAAKRAAPAAAAAGAAGSPSKRPRKLTQQQLAELQGRLESQAQTNPELVEMAEALEQMDDESCDALYQQLGLDGGGGEVQ